MPSPFRVLLPCLALPLVAAAAACSTEPGTGTATDDTIEKSAKIVDEISPTATIEGVFDPKVRVYGYVVAVKAGAKITAKLEAAAGRDAEREGSGALDTVLAVHGPYVGKTERGGKVAESDDDGSSPAAAPVTFQAERDQKFLVSFSSWEDTGTGSYKLSLSCEGTDFQCQRANFDRACEKGDGPLYVQGSAIEGEVTWDRCEVVLLEPATVKPGSTLTIKPGVAVKGNYITFPNSANDRFGYVGLTVEGLLQAAGTPSNPVSFSGLKSDRGWGGLTFKSKGSSMRNVVIERANVGVAIEGEASVDVTDSYLEGANVDGQRSLAGIRAQAEVSAKFERAVVKGFERGLDLENARHFEITDAVIRENGIGVHVAGQGGSVTNCGNPPAPPAQWRDPVITHTDIVDNEQQGVLIAGNDVLVQVSESNLIGNGAEGISLQGVALAPESFFRKNNVFGNGEAGDKIDFRTWHRGGTIVLEGNYWKDISDPELSANWELACGQNRSPISFTGFAPKVLAAGPRKSSLTDRVKEQCTDAAAR